MNNSTKLEIKNLSKSYKKGTVKALNNFCANLSSGIYGLLGPNGAGKSTLMNILTDNINCDEGEVLFNNEDIKKLGKNYRDVIGYMPQQQGIYDDFSAIRFLWYMASLKGMKREETKKKIDELLETVNLTSKATRKIGTFSGGMKQRILIAQALLNDPKILILDEPTAGLDPKERIRIRNFVSKIATNKIVLISTHVVSDVEFIAKEIMLLKKGELIALDSSQNLIKSIEDKVYEIKITKEQINEIQSTYRVSNLYVENENIWARIVIDDVPTNFEFNKVSPTLEDVYLYNFE